MAAAPEPNDRRLPWALLRIVATRLALREHPASPRVRALSWLAGLVTAGCALALILGWAASYVLVGALAVASMVLLAALALRMFPAAMAVSVVGIALSCASLMTALAVTSGFLTEISRAVARFNGHLLLTKYGLDFEEYEALGNEIAEDPRVVAASPFAFSMVVVVRDDGSEMVAPAPTSTPAKDVDAAWGAAIEADRRLPSSSTPARGTGGMPDPERPAIVVGKGIDPNRAGGFSGLAPAFGKGDLFALRPANAGTPPGIVLGRALRRELGVEIGERVRVVVPAELDGREESATAAPRFAVFEVTDELHTGVAELDRNLVLMHLTAAQALFFRAGRVTGIEFELHDPDQSGALARELEGRLPPLYRVSTWQESNGEMLATLQQIRVVIAMILGLMGVVGAASLVASLLLVVRRKHHDIGVMLALGCDHRAVFWVFESVGLVAGAVGVLLGLGLGGLYVAVISAYRFPLGGDVYPIDHLPAQLAFADAAVPIAIAMTLCAVASGPVALLAARVRILTALAR